MRCFTGVRRARVGSSGPCDIFIHVKNHGELHHIVEFLLHNRRARKVIHKSLQLYRHDLGQLAELQSFDRIDLLVVFLRIIFVVSVQDLWSKVHLDAFCEAVHRCVAAKGHNGQGEVEKFVHALGLVVHIEAAQVVDQLACIQVIDDVLHRCAFEGLLQRVKKHTCEFLYVLLLEDFAALPAKGMRQCDCANSSFAAKLK
mmetsp:Transcript_55755/g.97685  ORF Transcript_55755/g.97685 Transcript_55755/m.97685 type:complete len:200 (-) Transcript_55755:344-943(-)